MKRIQRCVEAISYALLVSTASAWPLTLAAETPQLAAGYQFTLGLDAEGTAWAWGLGPLGDIRECSSSFCTSSNKVPVRVDWPHKAIAIAAGEYHAIALRSDGTVWTWGDNFNGQLGNGTTTDSASPTQVPGLDGVVDVAAGRDNSFALKADRTLWAWGAGGLGRLGTGTGKSSSVPVRVIGLEDVTEFGAGYKHAVALRADGSVWAWGGNLAKQLGSGVSGIYGSDVPVSVPGLVGVSKLAVGYQFTLALNADGTVQAWGDNRDGQLGNGTTVDTAEALPIPGLVGVSDVAAGSDHALAISGGNVWAWGSNFHGQLGNNSRSDSTTPVQVIGLTDVVAIAAGSRFSAALRADGSVWAWGYGLRGQLGVNSSSSSTVPVQVLGPAGIGLLNLGVGPPPPPHTPKLAVTPPPSTDFGAVEVGASSTRLFVAKNVGTALLTGSVLGNDVFTVMPAVLSLSPGEESVIGVRFAPKAVGPISAVVQFDSNGGSVDYPVSGTGATDLPAITSISPGSGPAKGPLVVSGTNFGAVQGGSTVTFCGKVPIVTYWDDTTIAFPVPSVKVGSQCAVIVKTPEGLATSTPFEVTLRSGVFGRITSASGLPLPGVRLTIIGPTLRNFKTNSLGQFNVTGLTQGSYTIKPSLLGYEFSPASASINVTDAPMGDVNFVGLPVLPKIASMTPSSGREGTVVTIMGTGFGDHVAGVSRVTFGAAPAEIQSWADTQIVVGAPAATTALLVRVWTEMGVSNEKRFSYKTGTVRVVPNGNFKVLLFARFELVSAVGEQVTQRIEIENNTRTWYYTTVTPTGDVAGSGLPSEPFLLGPRQKISLGEVTFSRGASLRVFADNTIDLSTLPPVETQTRAVLGALGGDLLWRALVGSPYPVSEAEQLMFLARTEFSSPIFSLGMRVYDFLVRRNVAAALGFASDMRKVLEDPFFVALLAKHGYSVPEATLSYLLLYGRAAVASELLIQTLIYPHYGSLTFSAQ